MAKKSGNKPYTLGTFIFDLIMGSLTFTLWWWYRLFRILTTK